MTRILLVLATQVEAGTLVSKELAIGIPTAMGLTEKHQVDILVTGAGAVPTTFHLTRNVSTYNLIVNLGIAGSYRYDLTPGSLVAVATDAFADYGVDNNGHFEHLNSLDFNKVNSFRLDKLENPWLNQFNLTIPAVRGITVGTASGSAEKITMLREQWNPDIETMESAAVFFTCLTAGKPFICLRAISNAVEPRNPQNWRIKLAVERLADFTLNLLENKIP
jgi:futalosine hydrolase